MLELDVLLLPFVENCYDNLKESEKRQLAHLLEQNDVDILDFLRNPDQSGEFEEIVSLILKYRKA